MPDELPRVAGVRFRNAGKIFYFHTAGMRLEPGEYVVVETTRGPEIARVVIAPDQVGFGKSSKPDCFQYSLQALATNTTRTAPVASA